MPTAPITGKPSGYIPAEYPKVVYNEEGKTALARNPDHAAELGQAGYAEDYVAPPAVAKPATPSTPGNAAAEELAAAKSTIRQLTGELMDNVTKSGATVASHVSLNQALREQLDLLKAEFAGYKAKALAAAEKAAEEVVATTVTEADKPAAEASADPTPQAAKRPPVGYKK